MSQDGHDIGAELEQLQRLIADVEREADPAMLERARGLVHGVLSLHREGLARILELAREQEGSEQLLHRLGQDPRVAGLLALHELHPQTLHERVQEAVEEVRPRLRGQNATVDEVTIRGDTIEIRVRGEGPAGQGSLEQLVRQTVLERVPEAELDVSAEVVDTKGVVPAERLRRSSGEAEG